MIILVWAVACTTGKLAASHKPTTLPTRYLLATFFAKAEFVFQMNASAKLQWRLDDSAACDKSRTKMLKMHA